MLVGLECQQRVGKVHGVRGGNIDDVDVRVLDQLLVRAVGGNLAGVRALHILEEGPRPRLGRRGGDRGDRVLHVGDAAGGRVEEEVLDKGLGNAAGGEDAPLALKDGHGVAKQSWWRWCWWRGTPEKMAPKGREWLRMRQRRQAMGGVDVRTRHVAQLG